MCCILLTGPRHFYYCRILPATHAWCGLIGFQNLKVHVQMVLEEVGDKLKASARLHGNFWYKCHMYPCICDWRGVSDVSCGSHKSVLLGHSGKVSFFCYKNLSHQAEEAGFRWLDFFFFFNSELSKTCKKEKKSVYFPASWAPSPPAPVFCLRIKAIW